MKSTISITFIAFFLFFTLASLYSTTETLKITVLFENDNITSWTAFLIKINGGTKTKFTQQIGYESSKEANTATFSLPFTESFSGTITLNVKNADGIPVDFIYPGTKKKRIAKQYFRLSYIHMLTENPEYYLSADGRVFRKKESSIKKFLLEKEVDKPVIHPAGGTYNNDIDAGITTKSDADIIYTTNGENPKAEYKSDQQLYIIEGDRYTKNFKVTENNMTIIAQAYKQGLEASEFTAAVYTLQVSKLKIAPSGSSSNKPIEVVIKMKGEITRGAIIIYTIDGTEPALSNGIEYTGKITLTETTTIRAKAFKPGYLPAEEVSAVFTITESQ